MVKLVKARKERTSRFSKPNANVQSAMASPHSQFTGYSFFHFKSSIDLFKIDNLMLLLRSSTCGFLKKCFDMTEFCFPAI